LKYRINLYFVLQQESDFWCSGRRNWLVVDAAFGGLDTHVSAAARSMWKSWLAAFTLRTAARPRQLAQVPAHAKQSAHLPAQSTLPLRAQIRAPPISATLNFCGGDLVPSSPRIGPRLTQPTNQPRCSLKAINIAIRCLVGSTRIPILLSFPFTFPTSFNQSVVHQQSSVDS